MNDSQDTWRRLGDELTGVGERFRDHYRLVGADVVEEAETSGDDIRSAFETLGNSLDRVLSSVGNAFRDPDVQEDARRAANTLVDALGDSLQELGASLKHLIDEEQPPAEPGTWEPAAEDAESASLPTDDADAEAVAPDDVAGDPDPQAPTNDDQPGDAPTA